MVLLNEFSRRFAGEEESKKNGNNNEGSAVVGDACETSDGENLLVGDGRKAASSPIKKLMHRSGSKESKV